MGVIPESRAAKIEFCEGHVATWVANSVAMGSSSTAITAWQAKVVAARAAMTAQTAAAGAAKSATITFNLAIKALDAATSDVIKQIRLKASSGGDAIYALADIPAPATPTNRPAPGVCFNLKTDLLGDGSLKMTWECDNHGNAGTIYQVYRSEGGSTNFGIVGGSGKREMIDASIPAGATQLTYKIQALRSSAVGTWATFNVFFGSNVAGDSTVTVSPVKIAA